MRVATATGTVGTARAAGGPEHRRDTDEFMAIANRYRSTATHSGTRDSVASRTCRGDRERAAGKPGVESPALRSPLPRGVDRGGERPGPDSDHRLRLQRVRA